jgi:hypothetical protein
VVSDKPVVNILKPSGSQILGNIAVKVEAYDPNVGPCPSGLATLSASVSSAGGAFGSLSIPLTLDHTLSAPAPTHVTGTGTFTPTGGSGLAGSSFSTSFLSSSPRGIGTYVLSVTATDVAGNSTTATYQFAVNYTAAFTTVSVPGGCNPSHVTGACQGQFKFTLNRATNVNADDSSDGAPMFDQTVDTDLVAGSTVKSTHTYGTVAITACVQIDTSVPDYQTNYDNIGGAVASYVLKIYALDVDGHPMLQGTSNAISF